MGTAHLEVPPKKSCGSFSEAEPATPTSVVAQQPSPGRSCESPLAAQE